MKLKQIFILSGILVLLLAGVFLKSLQERPELATQEYTPLDLSFDVQKVSGIVIHRKQTQEGGAVEIRIEITRSDSDWTIPTLWGARADKTKVENFLKLISQAKGEVRAGGKDLFSDFEITDEQGFHIELLDDSGKKLLGLVIGTKKPNYQSLFIREQDSETVYLSDADIFGQMGLYGDVSKETPKSDYWMSNDFLFFDGAKVSSLSASRFKDGKETISLQAVKESGKWKFPSQNYPFTIDGEKVSKHLEDLKTWKAQKVLDPKAKDYGFAAPVWRMKIGIESAPEVTVTIGAAHEDGTSYYMQVSGEPAVYLLAKYYLENMDIDDAKFSEDNVLGDIAYDKVESLTVHADKQEFRLRPIEKNWDAMADYLGDMTGFKPARIIFDPKEAGGFSSKYWFEVQRKDKPLHAFEFGDYISDKKEYFVRPKGGGLTFTVSETVFKNIFETVERLKEPEPVKPTAQS